MGHHYMEGTEVKYCRYERKATKEDQKNYERWWEIYPKHKGQQLDTALCSLPKGHEGEHGKWMCWLDLYPVF